MSTTSMAPPAPAATAPLERSRSVRWTLARAEGRRLLRHPLFALGMIASALMAAFASGGDGGGTEDLSMVAGSCFLFVGAGIWTLLATSLAASRAHRDGACDLYTGQPVTSRTRTEAALLSLAWPGLAGAALITVLTLALTGLDGALVIAGERYAPHPLELAQGPLYVVLMGALGVLVGNWTQRVYPTVLVALVLFLPPSAWGPWIVVGDDVPRGFEYDWQAGASVAWHVTGLAGLALLAAAAALARHDRRARVAVLALAGLCATVAGVALGLPSDLPSAGR